MALCPTPSSECIWCTRKKCEKTVYIPDPCDIIYLKLNISLTSTQEEKRMEKNILIASATFVPQDKWEGFCAAVRTAVEGFGGKVVSGIIVAPGPGCNNYAFRINASDLDVIEDIANKITMALMPARWATTGDTVPEVDTYEI